MTRSSASSAGLSVDAAVELDRVCDAFERAWRGRHRPAIELAIAALAGAVRAAAVRELVELDVYYRRRAGEHPASADYAGRFPDLDPAWLETVTIAGPLGRQSDEYFDSEPTDFNSTGGGPGSGGPPPVIPGYTILERLGRGGMGEVYRVRDALGRELALKVARTKQLSATGRERFLSEARALFQLNHPNVVRVGHYGEKDGRPYFEMDLHPANLSDRLSSYTGDSRAAVRLMMQVAEGVGHLHARHFIHRDLKPSNILLTADGRPLVSDFGLIKGPSDSEAKIPYCDARGSAETDQTGARRSQTVAGTILGTRRYMAPDQAAGLNHQAGPAWDVWALGVMLHELLTGQPPRSSSAPDRLLNPVQPDNPPATRIKPDLDPRLGHIIDKCLARDPAARYPNGAAVAADLKGWLNRRRRMWTRVVAASLLALVAVITIAAAVNRPQRPFEPPAPTDEEQRARILADIQNQFREGKAVEVTGSTGLPRRFNLIAYRGSPRYVSDLDGTMRISTDGIALLEFPPTGRERYRLEVQIRQEFGDRAALFGVYAGRHRLPSLQGDTDCFIYLWFNDTALYRDHPKGPPHKWSNGAQSIRQVPGPGRVAGSREFYQGENFANVNAHRWHTLIVEVCPDQMTWSFDGEAAKPVKLPLPLADEAGFVKVAELVPNVRTAFSPSGGYGLVVIRGTASFRNARVTPLDQ